MGTNWTLHLGKTSSQAAGPVIVWHVNPAILRLFPRNLTVEDEYGGRITLGEWLDDVAALTQDHSQAGVEFS